MPFKLGERRDPRDVPRTYVTDTGEALRLVHEVFPSAVVIAGDTETKLQDKIDPMTARMRTFQIATRHVVDGAEVEHSYLLDFRDIDALAFGRALREVGRSLPRGRFVMRGFNAGFDDPVTTMNLTGCTRESYVPLIEWDDLMLYEGTLRQGAVGYNWYPSLSELARKYLGWEMEGKDTTRLSYDLSGDLSEVQKLYAHLDSVITLWLGDVLDVLVDAAELRETAEINENGGRPFLQAMEIHGLPFHKERWMAEVAEKEAQAEIVLGKLAEMTGGGQGQLFADSLKPNWNPDSTEDVKRVLNTFCRDRVLAYTKSESEDGRPRLLGKADSADKSALIAIGGELCDLLLEYSKLSKLRSTYGEKMMAHVREDGRIHSEYTQTIVDTGRASSRNPNAQNYHPDMKAHMEPHEWWRVIVMGDYSQAELRGMAELTGEQAIIDAYAAGKDLHEDTAARMFPEIDLEDLKVRGETDPDAASRYEKTRGKAKSVNFGMPYGLRATGLSRQMRDKGIPMTKAEADTLLAQWATANPVTAAWLQERDEFIATLAENPPACDFRATWTLHKMFKAVTTARKQLKDAGNTHPSVEQIVEQMSPRAVIEADLTRSSGTAPTPVEVEAELARRAQKVAWARGFLGPVVLLADGTPFQFESRTWANRRRLFQVSTDAWIDSMVQIAAREPKAAGLVDAWAADKRVSLSYTDARGKRRPISKDNLKKVFDGDGGRELKLDFVMAMLNAAGSRGAENLMRRALSDRIRAMGNAYRNAPIQGGVADAVLRSFGLMHQRLAAFPTAFPVLTVHDSVGIECDVRDAEAVRALMKDTMEEAMAVYCKRVVVVADVEIHRNLSKKGRLTAEQVAELAAKADAELGPREASAA